MSKVLNMTVGQTEIHPVIKKTINDPIPVPTYFSEYKDLQTEMLKKAQLILGTKMPVYLKLGIGRVGLETGLYNVIDSKTKVLAIDNGQWGHFSGALSENMGADVKFFVGEKGADIRFDELEKEMEDNDYDIVTMVQNETQTGSLYRVDKVSEIIKKNSPKTLLFVDAISSFGGTEIKFDEWGIDIIVTGSQKCLNAPQGCPLVCYSEKAVQRMNAIKDRKFYFSTALDNNPEFIFARALNELFSYMLYVGLENIYAEHETAARATRAGLKALGLDYMANDDIVSPSTTRIIFPNELQQAINKDREEKGIDKDRVTEIMKDKYGVCIAEDRIGTMGFYTRKEDITFTISALAKTMIDLGYDVDIDKAVLAVSDVYNNME